MRRCDRGRKLFAAVRRERKFNRRTKLRRWNSVTVWGLVFKVAVDFHRRQLYGASRRFRFLPRKVVRRTLIWINFRTKMLFLSLSIPFLSRQSLSLSRAHSNLFLTPLLSPSRGDGVVNREFTFRTFHLVGAPPGRWGQRGEMLKKAAWGGRWMGECQAEKLYFPRGAKLPL